MRVQPSESMQVQPASAVGVDPALEKFFQAVEGAVRNGKFFKAQAVRGEPLPLVGLFDSQLAQGQLGSGIGENQFLRDGLFPGVTMPPDFTDISQLKTLIIDRASARAETGFTAYSAVAWISGPLGLHSTRTELWVDNNHLVCPAG